MNELSKIQTPLTHRILRLKSDKLCASTFNINMIQIRPYSGLSCVEGKSMVKFHPPHERWLKKTVTEITDDNKVLRTVHRSGKPRKKNTFTVNLRATAFYVSSSHVTLYKV